MAQTSSSRKTRFIAECASLLLAALALSYLESLIPITYLVPLPGFKLGFANIAVIIAFYRISPYAAILISFTRVVISSLLFSGVTTLLFSLSGAAASLLILIIIYCTIGRKISFIGLSVIMALFHNVGQIICASFVMHSTSIGYYFPILATASLICGTLTGIVLISLPESFYSGKETK